MSAFPLQELPFVVLRHQLKCMSIQDLLNLSRDSSKMRTIIKQVGIRSGGYDLDIHGFGWSLYMANGSYGTNSHENDKDDSVGTLIGAFRHLQTLFPGSVNTLTVCPTMAESLMVFEQFMPKECNLLIVNSEFDSEHRPFNGKDPNYHNWLWYPEPELSKQQRVAKEEQQQWLDQFLNTITFKYGIILQGAGRPETDLDKICNLDFLKVDYSDWITTDELDLLQNRLIYLDRSEFSNEAVNEYLMKFKSGNGNTQLEILTIKGYEQDPDWDENVILEGLNAKRWNPKERSQRFLNNESNKTKLAIITEHFEWQYENGVDLTDAHDFICDDGTRCSVLVEGSKMQLFVWRQEPGVEVEEKEGRKRRMDDDDAPEVKRRPAE